VPGDVPAAAADRVVAFSSVASSGMVEDSISRLEIPMLLNE
jgi:hypothetical protein